MGAIGVFMKKFTNDNWIGKECSIELKGKEEFISNKILQTRSRFLEVEIISKDETGLYVSLLTENAFNKGKLDSTNEQRFIPWTSIIQVCFSVIVDEQIDKFLHVAKKVETTLPEIWYLEDMINVLGTIKALKWYEYERVEYSLKRLIKLEKEKPSDFNETLNKLIEDAGKLRED
jgi:hypothetical protein